MGRAWPRTALQGEIKTTQNITGAHLLSIRNIGEVPPPSPKYFNRHLPQPVRPAGSGHKASVTAVPPD